MTEILYYLVKVLSNTNNLHREIGLVRSMYDGIIFDNGIGGYLVPKNHVGKIKHIIGQENSDSVRILKAGTIDLKF